MPPICQVPESASPPHLSGLLLALPPSSLCSPFCPCSRVPRAVCTGRRGTRDHAPRGWQWLWVPSGLLLSYSQCWPEPGSHFSFSDNPSAGPVLEANVQGGSLLPRTVPGRGPRRRPYITRLLPVPAPHVFLDPPLSSPVRRAPLCPPFSLSGWFSPGLMSFSHKILCGLRSFWARSAAPVCQGSEARSLVEMIDPPPLLGAFFVSRVKMEDAAAGYCPGGGPGPLGWGDIGTRPSICSVISRFGSSLGGRTLLCSEPTLSLRPHLPEIPLSLRLPVRSDPTVGWGFTASLSSMATLSSLWLFHSPRPLTSGFLGDSVE